MARPDWDKYFMEITEMVATRTTCLRRGVGAVIVKENSFFGSNATSKQSIEIDGFIKAGSLVK